MVKMRMEMLIIVGLFVMSKGVDGNTKLTEEEEEEIDRKLKLLNKPAVKTIQSEDGDIIDCVDIHKQPAFDRPDMKNHTIQMRPNFKISQDSEIKKDQSNSTMVIFQTWQKNGSCPNGTIPIRRIRKEDLLRLKAASLERFAKKKHASPNATNHRYVMLNNIKIDNAFLENRSVASLITVGYNYLGAKGDLNVWNPSVQYNDEFNTAQIWLKAGPGDAYESVESGWTVNPLIYGDRNSRFFAYWTGDAYKSKGCFDLTCSGFVQTGTEVALGAAVAPWSSDGGQQYYISIQIRQDPPTGNWWLTFGENKVVGYWPGSIFSYLRHSAILVEWGGEVYSSRVRTSPHTATQMGSGNFASDLWGSACFVNHARMMDLSLEWKYPQFVVASSNEAYCYSAFNFIKDYTTEPVFFFGGPGSTWNPNCQ